MDFAGRKPNRLQEYDYDTDGFYFVTICARDRRRLLSDIVGDDAHIVPKAYGRIAEKCIHNAREIEKYVIMPDHIHMIIRLDSGSMWASTPTAGKAQHNYVSGIVRSLKILVTKEIGESIFQRSYYDQEDLDAKGKPKRKPRRKVPFIELAVKHGLASPDTADKTYRRALEKMRKALSK